jgi:primase-polymerase (primpol)-like protein
MHAEKKPQAPELRADAIPEELKALRRWVAWNYKLVDGTGPTSWPAPTG